MSKVFFLCVMWYEMTVHTVSVLTLNCLNIYCILNVMSTFNIVKIKCLKKKSTHIYWFIYWFFNRYRVFNLLKLQSGPILMQNVPCSFKMNHLPLCFWNKRILALGSSSIFRLYTVSMSLVWKHWQKLKCYWKCLDI